MKQADFCAGRHDARREYEWKVTLGFWALILGAIAFLKNYISEGHKIDWRLIPIIGVGYAFLWLRGVWVANKNDQLRAFHFRDAAEQTLLDANYKLLASPVKVCGFKKWFGFLFDWAMQFQLFVTVFLLIVAYYLITNTATIPK